MEEKTFEAECRLWNRILNELNINLTPGNAFHCPVPGWFRVCFASQPLESLETAMDRIRTKFLWIAFGQSRNHDCFNCHFDSILLGKSCSMKSTKAFASPLWDNSELVIVLLPVLQSSSSQLGQATVWIKSLFDILFRLHPANQFVPCQRQRAGYFWSKPSCSSLSLIRANSQETCR
jgi:hypothetical protein